MVTTDSTKTASAGVCATVAALLLSAAAPAAQRAAPTITAVTAFAYQSANLIEVDATVAPSPLATTIRFDWYSGSKSGGSEEGGTGPSTSPTVFVFRFEPPADQAAFITVTAVNAEGQTLAHTDIYFGGSLPRATLTVSQGGLRITSTPVGIDCGIVCAATFSAGTTVALHATPRASATGVPEYVRWTSGPCAGSSSPDCSVTLGTASVFHVDAIASPTLPPPNTVAVIVVKDNGDRGLVVSDPPGIDCGMTCGANFTPGQPLTLRATAVPGWMLDRWTGACSGKAATCALTPTTNPTQVGAVFAPWPTLTVSRSGTGQGNVTSSPAGIDCGATCAMQPPPGTSVTLHATSDDGSVFTGWTGGCSGTGDCTLTVTADTSVTATFTKLPTLSVSLQGNGRGSVVSEPAAIDCGTTCAATLQFGSRVTLTAVPFGGSRFAGWSGACAGTRPCPLDVNADVATSARFVLIPCVVPQLRGRTLAAARVALAGAHCSLGRVTHRKNAQLVGRVVAQSPAAGRTLAAGAKVALTIGVSKVPN